MDILTPLTLQDRAVARNMFYNVHNLTVAGTSTRDPLTDN